MDGQLKREWTRAEIQALAAKEAGLEESLAQAIGG
jgi:hypothetical protein